MVTIIDYGIGNLGSVANMIRKIGATSTITSNPEQIANAEKLILCGVGSFDDGMSKLQELGLVELLNKKVLEEKVPILGICLGMQLFTRKSEEGNLPGLGWFDAQTIRFREAPNSSIRSTHMGWNEVMPQKHSRLFTPFHQEEEQMRYYFVHQYHVVANNDQDTLATTSYGYNFCSALEKDNIVGVQFHPEKSHNFGIQLLRNFIHNY